MIRQIGIYLLFSIIAILFLTQVHWVLNILVIIYHGLEKQLHLVFASDRIGSLLSQWLALMLVPAIIALVFQIVYWIIKRQFTHMFFVVMWLFWLLLVALLK